jgi:hypothetical protein
MTTEERLEIIKNKAKQIADKEKIAAQKEAEEQQTLVDEVRMYFEQIQNILTLANACDNNGIKMPWDGKRYGYNYSFRAQAFYHHVGLIYTEGEYRYIGIDNSETCGKYAFCSDGRTIKGNAKIYDMKKFLEEFPQFEKAFLAWIDNMEV